jgi:hypothetical protein
VAAVGSRRQEEKLGPYGPPLTAIEESLPLVVALLKGTHDGLAEQKVAECEALLESFEADVYGRSASGEQSG